MDIGFVLSIVTPIAAVASAFLSFRSGSIAARALELAKRNRNDRDRPIVVYIIDSFISRNSSSEAVSFALSLINCSDAANSIVRMDLEVHYAMDNGVIGHLLFPGRGFSGMAPNHYELQSISVPISLSARATSSGWITFEVPRSVIRGPIDYYCLVATTALGERVEKKSYLIREVKNEMEELS